MDKKYYLNQIILLIFLFLIDSCQPPSGETQLTDSDNFRFLEQDITEFQQGYKDGSYTIKDVVMSYLDRIDKIDKNGPGLNSIIQVNPDAVRIRLAVARLR